MCDEKRREKGGGSHQSAHLLIYIVKILLYCSVVCVTYLGHPLPDLH